MKNAYQALDLQSTGSEFDFRPCIALRSTLFTEHHRTYML